MLYYELKKILVRTGSRVIILFLCGLLVAVCYFATHNPTIAYINEQGVSEYGFEAVQKQKAIKKEWSGELTEEVIAKVIEENARINDEALRAGIRTLNDITYGKTRGFSDIRDLINRAFCEFREYDYFRIDSLSPEVSVDFYDRRVANLKEWLYSVEGQTFSDDEKEFFISRYGEMDIPIYYDYMSGWEMFSEYAPTVIMIMLLLMGFLVVGIFAGEAQYKADAIFFSSYHGRKRAVLAKLGAGVLLVTVIYWVMVLLYSAVVLGYLGFDGANTVIQTGGSGWKSFYNITYFDEFLLTIFGGYIGCLVISLLTMFVAAKTKSSVFAVTIPFILIFLPSLLLSSTDVGSYKLASKILCLMPDQLLQVHQMLAYFALYKIGSVMVGTVEVSIPLHAAVSVVLMFLIYWVYRRSEVR